MSKYNNMKSIAIEDLSEKDLEQAIKEWAEGDDAMERLLWSCYRNGVKTSGCHAGNNPYIGIEYEEKSRNKIVQLISSVMHVKGIRIILSPDGCNPFSGPNWYKPDIAIGSSAEYKDEADQLFDIMNNELKINETKNENYTSIIKLFEFLIGRYSGIHLRILHTQNDEYIFSIDKPFNEKEIETFNELNEILTSAGLTYIDNNNPHKEWIFKSNEEIDFIKNLNSISKIICNNYTLKKPESIEETSSFNIKAHIKRDEYIRNGNERGFELWLIEEERRLNEKMAKIYAERKKGEIK